MKKIITTIALVTFTVISSTVANAQKIAHIQVDSLISLMPESKAAQETLQKYLKDLESQIASMEGELQTKYQKYLDEQAGLSELLKQTREKELQDLQRRTEDFKQQAQTEYQRKSQEISKPIYDKAKKGIDAVAKENGYKYVLDTSTGTVIYFEASDDILPLVKKKLESMPAAVLPGANNGGAKPMNNGTKTTPAPKAGGTK
jgi:outer membrane protein